MVCFQIIIYLDGHDSIPHDQSACLKLPFYRNQLTDWKAHAYLLDIWKCFDLVNHDILPKK